MKLNLRSSTMVCLLILLVLVGDSMARRGRARGRTKSRVSAHQSGNVFVCESFNNVSKVMKSEPSLRNGIKSRRPDTENSLKTMQKVIRQLTLSGKLPTISHQRASWLFCPAQSDLFRFCNVTEWPHSLSSVYFQMQIGLPITGKYRDPESDQYYNNNNVIYPRSETPFCNAKLACVSILGSKNNAGLTFRLRIRSGPQDCVSLRCTRNATTNDNVVQGRGGNLQPPISTCLRHPQRSHANSFP